MERNPKKSKAFIITFIAILALLLIGYFVFRNSTNLFGIKGNTTTDKNYTPLLGTSKQKVLPTKNEAGTPADSGTVTNTATTIPKTNLSIPGGTIAPGSVSAPINQPGVNNPNGSTPIVPPPFNPLPTPADCTDASGAIVPCGGSGGSGGSGGGGPVTVSQCSDGIDNDGDGLIDEADSGCHSDYNAQNNLTYDININDESGAPEVAQEAAPMCPDDPLEFTAEEQAQIAILLKQYYLLASTIKIEDDVTLVDFDNQNNQELLKQATSLINDCKAQKANPSYTGPREVKDNPYYQNPTPNSNSPEYITNYSIYELMFNIW